ncbi:MAG: PKD domain-containing protein [Bacteroidota bacterium]
MRHIIYAILIYLLSTIGLQAQCTFTVSDQIVCGMSLVDFEVVNPNGLYSWDFDGDWVVDTYGDKVSHQFPPGNNNQTYTVRLFRNNSYCGSDTVYVLSTPDASIGVVPGSGIMDSNIIRVCSGLTTTELSIFNASATLATNVSYEVEWGDGSVETFSNTEFTNTSVLTHEYNGFGYYNIRVTVNGTNACQGVADYRFYNGSNPSVGLANPGNTVGLCAPATITFPITNTGSNPSGTVYNIYVSGELINSYTQKDVPSSFTYTFDESSCGRTTSTGNYYNAFDVQIEAVNPCGSSQATIEPIEVSEPPDPAIDLGRPEIGCVYDVFTLTSASTVLEVNNGNCSTNLSPSWEILPGANGVDWELLSGNLFSSDIVELAFLLPGEYTIRMVINSEACGEFPITRTINILERTDAEADAQVSSAASPPNGSCAPLLASFTNASTGDSLLYDWSVQPSTGWSFANGTDAESGNVELLLEEPGVYQVSLNAYNRCSNDVWDTTIIVAGPPVVEILPIGGFCETATLDFDPNKVSFFTNGAPFTNIQWSFPGATPAGSTDQYPTNIQYDSPGTYEVSLTASNECGSSTHSTTFTIFEPGSVFLSPDTGICMTAGGFQLFASPGGGNWTGPGVNPSGWFNPLQANIGRHTLVYTFNQSGCLSTDSLVVDVWPDPTVEAGPDLTFCVDDSPQFVGGGSPAGGTWAIDGSGVLLSGSVFDPAASGDGVYTLTYTYTDPNGCSNSDVKKILVNPLPIVEAGLDQSICFNPNDVQLNGAVPVGGVWSGPGVTASGRFNAANTPGVGAYTLYYSFTDTNTGCTATDSLVVTVTPNDQADAGPDLSVCINDDYLPLNSGTPMGGVWSGPGVSSAASLFDPVAAGVGLHTLTYTVGSGICQSSDELVVIVRDVPIVVLPEPASFCADDAPVPLTAQPLGGVWTGPGIQGNSFDPSQVPVGVYLLEYEYTDPNTGCSDNDFWRVEILPIPQVSASDTLYCSQAVVVGLPAAQPLGGVWSGPGVVGAQFDPLLAGGVGIYTLNYSYTTFFGCSNSVDVQVEVVDAPPVEAGPNDTLCIDGGLLTFTDYSPNNGQWSGPGIADPLRPIFDPTLAGPGRHIITYSLGKGSCLVQDSRTIWVFAIDPVDAGPDEELCIIEGSIRLSGFSPAGGVWSGDGLTDVAQGIFDPATAGVGTHLLTYTYTDPISGCSNADVKAFTVYPMDRPYFEMPEIVCRNEVVRIDNLSTGNLSVFWDFGDGHTSTDFAPEHTFEAVGVYMVKLTVENEFGCIDSTEQRIEVTDIPLALFELEASDACSGISLGLNNLSSGYGLSYLWDFGNGETSTDPNPDLLYYLPGIEDTSYIVTLRVSNLCGTSFHQDVIQVHPIPQAGIGISTDSDCSPITVSFANTTIGNGTSFFWDFGNGQTSTDPIPEPQTYSSDGNINVFTVTLIAFNVCSSDTTTSEVVVTPPDVKSVFGVQPRLGCESLEVVFTNQSDPKATIDWDFGDGNTSSLPNPTHVYDSPGTYEVIQYASTVCGYDTSMTTVTVLPAPEVKFSHNAVACLGQVVQFYNQSDNLSGNFWDFGDGTTSILTSPTHTYQKAGIYTVRLRGISMFNQCESEYISEVKVLDVPIADFVPSSRNGCVPFRVDFVNNSTGATYYKWNFGDGNVGVGESVDHIFTEPGSYDVSLIATDENGCFKDTTILNILVHPSPQSGFAVEQDQLCQLPARVEFENQSVDADAFEWLFGDGTTSSQTNPEKLYNRSGIYPVQLVAINQYACRDTFGDDLRIYPQPKAELAIGDAEGCVPVSVLFENNSENANIFRWNFGDGQSSDERTPSHTYETKGRYDVELIASIDDVCFDTMRANNLVRVEGVPVANFSFEEIIDNGLRSGTYQFTNLSTGAENYYWDFGDGNESREIDPLHRYSNNGDRQIYLEASTNFGCVHDTVINLEMPCIKGLFIPNGFSPEQGIGDVRLFKPKGVGLKEYHIQVYSPYGQLIWESTEISNGMPAESWDGTLQGELLQQDVYVWKATAIFCDGTSWKGMKTENGGLKTMGSLILLR